MRLLLCLGSRFTIQQRRLSVSSITVVILRVTLNFLETLLLPSLFRATALHHYIQSFVSSSPHVADQSS